MRESTQLRENLPIHPNAAIFMRQVGSLACYKTRNRPIQELGKYIDGNTLTNQM